MVLKSTRNLCFEQKPEKYQNILSENFPCLVVKFSIYLNRHVFVMVKALIKLLEYAGLSVLLLFTCDLKDLLSHYIPVIIATVT